MGERVLVSLRPGDDRSAVLRDLEGLGHARVAAPAPELPDVSVVELDDDADVDTWLERASGLEGVEAAERDALRWDMGPSEDRGTGGLRATDGPGG